MELDADPDILPRTDNFGLDYQAFAQLCDGDTIPDFLKLTFHCCIFDPKSRPLFSEIITKLENITKDLDIKHNSSWSCSENNSTHSSPARHIGIKSEISKRNSVDVSLLRDYRTSSTDSVESDLSSIPQSTLGTPVSEKERSIYCSKSNKTTGDITDEDDAHYSGCHKKLQHRRSLSETVSGLVFWPHTAPSDKARCHLLQRGHPTPPRHSAHSNIPVSNRITLNKIAEIMLLKDPHYKPRKASKTDGDSTSVSSTNPFTTFAQFRGVKKILGGSPSSYASGVGDLFSSCFELPSPFFGGNTQGSKFPNTFDEIDGVCKKISREKSPNTLTVKQTNSLPVSPVLSRQNSFSYKNSDKSLPIMSTQSNQLQECVNKLVSLNLKSDTEKASKNPENDQLCTADSSKSFKYQDISYCPKSFQSLENSEKFAVGPEKCTKKCSKESSAIQPIIKNSANKIKAKSLFTHPLFKNVMDTKQSVNSEFTSAGSLEDQIAENEDVPEDAEVLKKTSPVLLQKSSSSIELSNENTFSPNLMSLKGGANMIRRRGSCESGIFSVVNEDFSSPNCIIDCYNPNSVCPCVLRYFCHCKCPETEKCLFSQNVNPCATDPTEHNAEDKNVTKTCKAENTDSLFENECDCKDMYREFSQESGTVHNKSCSNEHPTSNLDEFCEGKHCKKKLETSEDKKEECEDNGEECSHFKNTSNKTQIRTENKSGCDSNLSLCHNCLDNYCHILHHKYCFKNINVEHALGCRTFSSSSANSSLFFLDDSAMSTTTVSSLRSLDDLDCINPSPSREQLKGTLEAENITLGQFQCTKHSSDTEQGDCRQFSDDQVSEVESETICGQCNLHKTCRAALPSRECHLLSRCCLLYHNIRSNVCPCHRSYNVDIDARSVDLGLVNRLAMDEEISNMILQRNTLTNQLLYSSSKRTSSIYTDSSDDISSLAGSDSLYFEDRINYSGINNTRSAQISKIVEYFERKGASFKPSNLTIPSATSYTSNPRFKITAGPTFVPKISTGDLIFSNKSTRKPGIQTEFLDVKRHLDNDARNISESQKEYSFGETGRRMAELRHRLTSQGKFADLCLNLDVGSNSRREEGPTIPSCARKCLSQQRLMVCEGAVKSKLQLFDGKK